VPSHFDVQIDQNGDEVIAGVSKEAPYSGLVVKRRLSDGFITPLTRSGYASHTSGRNLNRPGWVFVTYQNLQTNPQYLPYINEIDAVKLDGSRVERICNIRVNKYAFSSPSDQYLAEAHGCPSPDGLRVVFASDWNKGAYPIQAYVADFRDKVIPTSVQATEKPDIQSYALFQNYPNPFSAGGRLPAGRQGSASGGNPITRIKYTIGGAGSVPSVSWTGRDSRSAGGGPEGLGLGTGTVRLIVYDILGREVAVLVDEEKAPGNYEVQFDGSGLASGVYIYRLAAGAFVQSRRMLLVK
jgi:hypothetical protein